MKKKGREDRREERYDNLPIAWYPAHMVVGDRREKGRERREKIGEKREDEREGREDRREERRERITYP